MSDYLQIADDRIAISGSRIVVAKTTDPCLCGCIRDAVANCISTCDQWCHPDQAEGEKAECCDCPCPGRRCLPPGYDVTWGGVVIRSDRFFIGRWDDSGKRGDVYATLSGAGVGVALESDHCMSGGEITAYVVAHPVYVTFEIEEETTGKTFSGSPAGPTNLLSLIVPGVEIKYNEDGSCYLSWDHDGAGGGQWSLNWSVTANLSASGESDIFFTPAFLDTGGIYSDMRHDDSLVLGGDKCAESTVTTVPLLEHGGAAGPGPTYVDPWEDHGELSWTPTCLSCTGDPLQTASGNPASYCGDPTFSGFFWDGVNSASPVYEFIEVVLERAQPDCPGLMQYSATWLGDYGYGGITIAPVDLEDDEPVGCGPECGCNSDGVDWLMSVTYTGSAPGYSTTGNVQIVRNGSCPPANSWDGGTIISDTFPDPTGGDSWHDLTLGYAECPP